MADKKVVGSITHQSAVLSITSQAGTSESGPQAGGLASAAIIVAVMHLGLSMGGTSDRQW
jgi:hypothetical protein